MLDELELNGSGAATFDSFYSIEKDNKRLDTKQKSQSTHLFTLLADHGGSRRQGDGRFALGGSLTGT